MQVSRLLTPQERSPWYPPNKRPCEAQSRSGCFGREKIFFPCLKLNPRYSSRQRSFYTLYIILAPFSKSSWYNFQIFCDVCYVVASYHLQRHCKIKQLTKWHIGWDSLCIMSHFPEPKQIRTGSQLLLNDMLQGMSSEQISRATHTLRGFKSHIILISC
jgi:hypothetical protein